MGGAYLPLTQGLASTGAEAHWDQTMEARCPLWSQVKSQQGFLPGWGQELLSKSGSDTLWAADQFYW